MHEVGVYDLAEGSCKAKARIQRANMLRCSSPKDGGGFNAIHWIHRT